MSGRRAVRTIAAAAFMAFLAACATVPVPSPVPPPVTPPEPSPPPDADGQIRQAEVLAGRGSYLQLQRAFEIYERLHGFAALKPRLAAPFLETALLLTVREKELGIWNTSFVDRAVGLFNENPPLAGYRTWLNLAGYLWPKGRGVVPKVDDRFLPDALAPALKAAAGEMAEGAARSPALAYLFASYKWYDLKPLEKADGLDDLVSAFPNSLLLKFKKALLPAENGPLLEALLAEEPEFVEAYFHLGVVSLARGKLVEAEERLLKALPALSRSQALLIRLASVYFALEEVDSSLEYFEKALFAFADNGDALLGKAICLGLLGRNDEAQAVLDRILALGGILTGECHYWKAWNHQARKDLEAAAGEIARAKDLLPTSAEVFALSGEVEMEKGRLAEAERDLQESLKFNQADAQVMFNLGNVYALQSRWLDSAVVYRTSGFVFGENAKSLTAKIAEVRESGLSEARKARLLRKKELQRRQAEVSRATAFFNAAAGYANSGNAVLALASAQDAAVHPAMAARAKELIAEIRKRMSLR